MPRHAAGDRLKPWKHQALEAGAASAVSALVSRLPRGAALAFGRGLGRAWSRLDRRHSAIARDNLRRSFPEWDEPRVARTAREVYLHFGQVMVDLIWLGRRGPEAVLSAVEVQGREHAVAGMAAGKGAILTTGHLGNWEVHGLVHGLLFGRTSVVARPLDNPALDARLNAFRAMAGNGVIYKQRALAQAIRALREKQALAILIDQNMAEGQGIFVDFFGRPASTTTVAAALALKTGAAILQGLSYLRDDGRYVLVYDEPLFVTPTPDRRADIERLTQELTRRIERAIRQVPGQWLWLHRRWKTQPPAGYSAPSAGA